MNPTKKFGYDENSEPPKNYVWVKNDKQYEFNVVSRNGKEVASTSSGTGSSVAGESSIDFENASLEDLFAIAITRGQYLRYEDIPVMKEGENPGYSRAVLETEIYAEDETNRYGLFLGYNPVCEIFKDTVGVESGGK